MPFRETRLCVNWLVVLRRLAVACWCSVCSISGVLLRSERVSALRKVVGSSSNADVDFSRWCISAYPAVVRDQLLRVISCWMQGLDNTALSSPCLDLLALMHRVMPPRRRGRGRGQIPEESEGQNEEFQRSIPGRRRTRQIDDEVDVLAARVD
ncbi:hypothetical protein F511_28792 [Dorcoceras hygrometricum]|uniref:Uncharacterized protein n=1 Tax=Dorcoceras hygrometricum TaxID=472368 RepID=A0A2Z7BG05_9LAMI|nr:hypothetical protein F511_28792 [Dorcoceras hygrometricum]